MMQNQTLAQSLSKNFDHILVDEYQDTSTLQGEVVHSLRPDGQVSRVVGDDAQAIYSFRAAAVENILGFAERYKPKSRHRGAGAELPLDAADIGCGQLR